MLSPRVEGRGVNLVADLIDPVNKEWKGNIIDNLFYDLEAAIIKNMPFCKSIEDDVLFGLLTPMEFILSNLDIGIYMSSSNMAYLGPQIIQCSRLFGRKFGDYKSQIKSSTWLGRLAGIYCQPRLI